MSYEYELTNNNLECWPEFCWNSFLLTDNSLSISKVKKNNERVLFNRINHCKENKAKT
jgi:hypothetical protein